MIKTSPILQKLFCMLIVQPKQSMHNDLSIGCPETHRSKVRKGTDPLQDNLPPDLKLHVVKSVLGPKDFVVRMLTRRLFNWNGGDAENAGPEKCRTKSERTFEIGNSEQT